MIIAHNKLVRDKIPDIIEASGKTCVCEVLPIEVYLEHLNSKLLEEVNEYLESGSVEELADICEVLQAILVNKNLNADELEKVRLIKAEERGGFTQRIFLKEVIEN
jgi:predicted house-cleaning noncanonical NTP pyrophosphatase (MazG superfamily)